MKRKYQINVPNCINELGSAIYSAIYSTDPENNQFTMPPTAARAIAEVHSSRQSFRFLNFNEANIIANRFNTSPDAHIIEQWLDIRKKDNDEFEVIFWLSICVKCEWNTIPKRTKSEHRELYSRIKRLCTELTEQLEQTGDVYLRGGGWGLQNILVDELLTNLETNIYPPAEGEPGHFTDISVDYRLPTIAELLTRVAQAADRLNEQGPIHTQPNKLGAQRGFFVRRIGRLFMQRYGEMPAEVIAALTTIVLDEVTDRELVTKLLK